MLQHRQPLESSRNSSDDSAKGSDADETLIALAVLFITSLLPTRCTVVGQTFNVLDNKKIRLQSAETQSFGTYSSVPKFVHDDCNAVSMVLSEDAPKKTTTRSESA